MAKTKISTNESVRELQKLINEIVNLKRTSDGSKKSLAAMQNKINSMKNYAGMTAAQFKSLSVSLEQNTRAVKGNTAASRSQRISTDKLTSSNYKLIAAQKKQTTSSKNQEEQAKKTKSAFGGALGSFKSLLSAFGLVAGVQLFANIVKNAFELAKTFDGIGYALQKIAGDMQDVATSSIFLQQITQDYGLSLVDTTERYIKFLAAAKQSGLALKDTELIFGSMSKAAGVLGLKTDELRGVYLALEQMLSKGKVTTEELRRQLGERLPGAMGIMAASMGVTISELDKMMKKGEVLSADVLPNFAKAVENAYGIEKVNKIETLVSAQNRLSNAWTNFIKTLVEGDSWIKKELMSTMEGWGEIMNGITEFFSNDDQKVILERTKYRKIITAAHKATVQDLLTQRSGYKNKLEALEVDIAKTTLDYQGESDKEQKKILKKHLDDLFLEKVNLQKKEENLSVSISLKNIESAKKEYEAKKEIYEDWQNFTSKHHGMTTKQRIEFLREQKKIGIRSIDDAGKSYAKAWEKYDFYRKNIQVSEVSAPDEVTPEGSTKKLKELQDLTNQLNAEQIKKIIEANKQKIDSEKVYYDEKTELLKANAKYEADLLWLDAQDKLAKIDEIKEADYVAETNGVTFKEMISKKKQLIHDQMTTAILKIDNKYYDESQKLAEDEVSRLEKGNKNKQLEIETKYYNDLENLRKTHKGTNEQLIKSEKELKEAFDKSSMENMISYFETILIVFQSMGAPTAELVKQIAKLKAELAGLGKGGDGDTPLFTDKEKLQAWLGAFKEIAEEIGALGDAIFDRRIENIEAEIDAETKKYDKLIELASNNSDEQARLEEEKQARLDELEKKKLKEEQKKARFEKASALVSIALNTAIGISAATSTGPLGLWAVPIIAALGALQAAAVLAQPIPQYATGLDYADKDHIAMINDGGVKEYVERDGQILSTDTKNAIVGLKKGDTVHKDYDSMINSGTLLSSIVKATNLANIQAEGKDVTVILDNHLKGLGKELKKGIRDGVRGIALHSHVKVDLTYENYKNNTL